MDGFAPAAWVIEGTEQNFETEVLQRSNEIPVIVDFWATWCGPCQQLGPILESLAQEAAGRFLLVKVDVDAQPGLAAAFGVQSIPHVFALKNGQLADQFMGALPEDQIRAWLERLQPSAAESLLLDAQRLETSDPATAEAKYREAMENDAQRDAAKIGLARLLLQQHREAESRTLIEELEARGFLEPEAENVKAELSLRAAAADVGDVAELRAAAAAAPQDYALQIKLADALAVAHQYNEALEICLNVVKQATGEEREQAKQTMVNMFQLLGPEATLTQSYRRKLSTAMY